MTIDSKYQPKRNMYLESPDAINESLSFPETPLPHSIHS